MRAPPACGAKRRPSVHVVSAATWETQSVEPSRKSSGFAPSNSRPVTTSGTSPMFVIDTFCGALTVPCGCTPPNVAAPAERSAVGTLYVSDTRGASPGRSADVPCAEGLRREEARPAAHHRHRRRRRSARHRRHRRRDRRHRRRRRPSRFRRRRPRRRRTSRSGCRPRSASPRRHLPHHHPWSPRPASASPPTAPPKAPPPPLPPPPAATISRDPSDPPTDRETVRTSDAPPPPPPPVRPDPPAAPPLNPPAAPAADVPGELWPVPPTAIHRRCPGTTGSVADRTAPLPAALPVNDPVPPLAPIATTSTVVTPVGTSQNCSNPVNVNVVVPSCGPSATADDGAITIRTPTRPRTRRTTANPRGRCSAHRSRRGGPYPSPQSRGRVGTDASSARGHRRCGRGGNGWPAPAGRVVGGPGPRASERVGQGS